VPLSGEGCAVAEAGDWLADYLTSLGGQADSKDCKLHGRAAGRGCSSHQKGTATQPQAVYNNGAATQGGPCRGQRHSCGERQHRLRPRPGEQEQPRASYEDSARARQRRVPATQPQEVGPQQAARGDRIAECLGSLHVPGSRHADSGAPRRRVADR